jgi:hypothetical protein
MQDQPLPESGAPLEPNPDKVRELQVKIASAMEGYEMEDCMPALFACVESGAVCSGYPMARTFTANHLRSLADRIEATK